jgi:murein DD-endopeptidase MepM/ murein hydrolase activator NlpD
VQPITGASTNGSTVRSSNATNNSVGFSVNSAGFGQCSSLKSPTKGVSVNSPYGWRWGKMHNGVDLAAPIGTPIYAASNGVVQYAQGGYNNGFGNFIEILSPEGIQTNYAHLDVIKCKEGQQVTIGQQIAEMGTTGNSDGPHLHFEIKLPGGSFVDPQDCMAFT